MDLGILNEKQCSANGQVIEMTDEDNCRVRFDNCWKSSIRPEMSADLRSETHK